jgi:anhydro-N-acetylmuramic acid kinase
MNNKIWHIIGLMSGTSLDGLDIVYTQIYKDRSGYKFRIIFCETIPYTAEWEHTLRNAFTASADEIVALNITYGRYLGEAVNTFISKNIITTIDFLASHGHTIFHKPNEGYTLQIGDGQTISSVTGLKIICDFRTQDVAFGGQGAPLVPIGDQLLFSQYKYCLNLGGFANISFQEKNKRIAFDICPVNIVLNHYSKMIGFNFDESGNIAKTGEIHQNLLDELNAISFYKAPTPKSLGFEFVKEIIFPIINNYQLEVEDVLRTFVAHIVFQIVNFLDNSSNSSLLITGGGAFNTFLIEELKNSTKNIIVIPDSDIINYKEALIFAFLGLLRNENKVNCLSSVTGAKKDHSSGEIFLKQV